MAKKNNFISICAISIMIIGIIGGILQGDYFIPMFGLILGWLIIIYDVLNKKEKK